MRKMVQARGGVRRNGLQKICLSVLLSLKIFMLMSLTGMDNCWISAEVVFVCWWRKHCLWAVSW